METVADVVFQIRDRLGVSSHTLEGRDSLLRAVAVAQHHDAITGTEREVGEGGDTFLQPLTPPGSSF